jgi:holo-[acyl-carrier protein] synthase
MSNIIGLGIDATDIDRIADTIERYGDRFLRRIFTEREIDYAMQRRVPAVHFAGRFAAKEAAMKALGTGHSQGVLWRDVEVVRLGGPPRLQLHGGAGERFARIGGRTSLLTITHSDDLAIAQVMILGEPASPKREGEGG